MIVDGKKIAAELIADLKEKISALPEKKFFGAVLVGDDPASINFLNQKEKVARELGIDFRLYRLPPDITTDHLRQEIGRLAKVKNCGGFIVQLPLPKEINQHYALNAIPKEKDLDLLSESALGAFYSGRLSIVSPAVATVQELLKNTYHDGLRTMTVAMVGAGFLIGKPVGFWLQSRVGELMVFDSKSENLHERLGAADIVISGAGQANLFSAKHLKEGAFVIDFGYSRNAEGKIAGDFDPTGAEEKNITYTKTPGGTGPILVAELYRNFYILNTKGVGTPGLEPGTAKV